MEYAERLMLTDVLCKLSSLSKQFLWNPWCLYGKHVNIILRDGGTFLLDDEDQPYAIMTVLANKIGQIVFVQIGEDQYDIEDYLTLWRRHVVENVLGPLRMLNNEYHIGALPCEIIGRHLLKDYKNDVVSDYINQYHIFCEEMRLLRNII